MQRFTTRLSPGHLSGVMNSQVFLLVLVLPKPDITHHSSSANSGHSSGVLGCLLAGSLTLVILRSQEWQPVTIPSTSCTRHTRWDSVLEDSVLLSASCMSSLQPLTKGLIPFCLPLGRQCGCQTQLAPNGTGHCRSDQKQGLGRAHKLLTPGNLGVRLASPGPILPSSHICEDAFVQMWPSDKSKGLQGCTY